MTGAVDVVAEGIRLAADAWAELRRSLWAQQSLGEVPSRLPDLSIAEAERKASVGRQLLARARAIDLDLLPHDLALTIRLVRYRAETWAREDDWYWTVVDPLGVGFFALFHPTAYCGGFLLNGLRTLLGGFRFREAGDRDRYLALAADYARMIGQMAERTSGQAERGVRLPKVQVMQARALFTGLKAQARGLWTVAPERLQPLASAGFDAELDRRIRDEIEPAFDRLLGLLSDDYLHRAPDSVGMSQYPGGAEIYADLVRMHTTLDLTPEQVHQIGLERMARIQDGMREIRKQAGFSGDAAAYFAQLEQDPRWRADSSEGVAAFFRRYIERLKPVFGTVFAAAPKAAYDVAPLPEVLQASMTFGYYDAPQPDRPKGLYLFNAGNLTKSSLFQIAALTYHELMPGHHLHIASQQENASLHPFRVNSFVNAFNEGWAEYAGTMVGELGLYCEPEERYGRLAVDAFLTSRLVVDTGMNALGWSLEQARAYLRTNTTTPEAEVRSETIRYSADIPAQSLAYKLGDTKIFELRQAMKQALGERFDLKTFHQAVLGPGALPLPDLEWHLQRVTDRLARAAA